MDKDSKFIKLCEFCGETSTCLCFECKELYCDSCFKYYHDKNLKYKHKKKLIDPYIPIELKCPDHPSIPSNVFCVEEKGK